MLLAGLVAGALYNPWSGPQTRDWLMDKVAGDDDLQPLDGFDLPGADESENGAAAAANGAAEAVADAVESEPTRRGEAQPRPARLAVLTSGRALRSPAGEGRLERARDEPARARDVVGLEQNGAGRRRDARSRRGRPVERQVGAAGVERHVLRPPPGVEERIRRDRAVVAAREQRDGWISKWRCTGENSASPVFPMNPSTSPALTCRPLTASGEYAERWA